MRRHPSLQGRLLIAMALVAAAAMLATLIAGFQLTRLAERQDQADALRRQADSLAAATPAARRAIVASRASSDPTELLALISPAGVATGSGAAAAKPRVVRAVTLGRDLSTSIRLDGSTVLVEARALPDGGGVLAAADADRGTVFTPDFALRMLVVLAIGLAVAVVAAIAASRALTRPLRRLRDQAARLARGERDVPAPTAGVAEIVEVEHAFSSLAAALAQSESRQREFLLSISHELRTPLTAIGGYGEALADGMIPSADVPGVGRTLVDETARLTAFTTDLLALARLEADDFRVQTAPADLADILRQTAEAWGGRASSVGVAVVALPARPAPATTDGTRIRQVVDGLVENALRCSPSGGSVRLAAGTSDGRAWIEVADDGPGLTAEDAAVAFERGALRERYREVRSVGTGLGLSIAARLIARLGGTIAARPGDAGGAVFRIEVPG